jgi:hypothetical protein
MSPVECQEQAAQCRRMAECEPNLRVQAILMDMARTWDRLAIEAEISQTSGPPLRVISQHSQASRNLSARTKQSLQRCAVGWPARGLAPKNDDAPI